MRDNRAPKLKNMLGWFFPSSPALRVGAAAARIDARARCVDGLGAPSLLIVVLLSRVTVARYSQILARFPTTLQPRASSAGPHTPNLFSLSRARARSSSSRPSPCPFSFFSRSGIAPTKHTSADCPSGQTGCRNSGQPIRPPGLPAALPDPKARAESINKSRGIETRKGRKEREGKQTLCLFRVWSPRARTPVPPSARAVSGRASRPATFLFRKVCWPQARLAQTPLLLLFFFAPVLPATRVDDADAADEATQPPGSRSRGRSF